MKGIAAKGTNARLHNSASGQANGQCPKQQPHRNKKLSASGMSGPSGSVKKPGCVSQIAQRQLQRSNLTHYHCAQHTTSAMEKELQARTGSSLCFEELWRRQRQSASKPDGVVCTPHCPLIAWAQTPLFLLQESTQKPLHCGASDARSSFQPALKFILCCPDLLALDQAAERRCISPFGDVLAGSPVIFWSADVGSATPSSRRCEASPSPSSLQHASAQANGHARAYVHAASNASLFRRYRSPFPNPWLF